MQILRIFNNNVVLARRGSEDVVVTGRGIAFGAKKGDVLDESNVQRVFVPADGRDPDHSGQMIAGLPAEDIHRVTAALEAVGAKPSITLVTAVTDHIINALERASRGEEIAYPLRAEVQHLYPAEYTQGERLLEHINILFDATLPTTEATALAMHLVNAGFNTGDLAHTYRMTGLIQQMMQIIAAEFGVEFEAASINVARFITHIRYLFVRLEQGKQLERGNSPLARELTRSYPREVECARKVAAVVELRFDTALTEDEIAYLALHIVRLSAYHQM